VTLGEAEAMRAIAAIRAELQRRGTPASIAVADAHGELIALLRMDGAGLSTGPIAANKAFTAARLRQPSRALGTAVRERGHQVTYYGDARYVGWAGGLPVLTTDGKAAIGAVAVSGLSQDDDEVMAALGVAAIAASGDAAR
jgi:glc operon protein GlcG